MECPVQNLPTSTGRATRRACGAQAVWKEVKRTRERSAAAEEAAKKAEHAAESEMRLRAAAENVSDGLREVRTRREKRAERPGDPRQVRTAEDTTDSFVRYGECGGYGLESDLCSRQRPCIESCPKEGRRRGTGSSSRPPQHTICTLISSDTPVERHYTDRPCVPRAIFTSSRS